MTTASNQRVGLYVGVYVGLYTVKPRYNAPLKSVMLLVFKVASHSPDIDP